MEKRFRVTELNKFCVVLAALVLAHSWAMAAVAIIPECMSCQNKGFEKCRGCAGKGRSDRAELPCDHCNEEGTVECRKCHGKGKVSCPSECKRKEGSKGTLVVNPKWAKWRVEKQKNPKTKSKEPAQFIPCERCLGEGSIACERCEGSSEVDCERCLGSKKITGRGKCPDCKGSGIAPCRSCAQLPKDAIEEHHDGLRALEILLEQKIIRQDGYWKRRRTFVAETKKVLLANRKQQEKVAQEQPKLVAKKVQSEDNTEMKRLKALKALLDAWAVNAVSIELYLEKRSCSGLNEGDLDQFEASVSKELPKLAKYLEVRKRFQRGHLDRAGFEASLKKIDELRK